MRVVWLIMDNIEYMRSRLLPGIFLISEDEPRRQHPVDDKKAVKVAVRSLHHYGPLALTPSYSRDQSRLIAPATQSGTYREVQCRANTDIPSISFFTPTASVPAMVERPKEPSARVIFCNGLDLLSHPFSTFCIVGGDVPTRPV